MVVPQDWHLFREPIPINMLSTNKQTNKHQDLASAPHWSTLLRCNVFQLKTPSFSVRHVQDALCSFNVTRWRLFTCPPTVENMQSRQEKMFRDSLKSLWASLSAEALRSADELNASDRCFFHTSLVLLMSSADREVITGFPSLTLTAGITVNDHKSINMETRAPWKCKHLDHLLVVGCSTGQTSSGVLFFLISLVLISYFKPSVGSSALLSDPTWWLIMSPVQDGSNHAEYFSLICVQGDDMDILRPALLMSDRGTN